MQFSFQITNDDGSVLAKGSEEVTATFSLLDFLNQTIPAWETTVKVFYEKHGDTFVPHFKDNNAQSTNSN